MIILFLALSKAFFRGLAVNREQISGDSFAKITFFFTAIEN